MDFAPFERSLAPAARLRRFTRADVITHASTSADVKRAGARPAVDDEGS